MIEQFEVTIDDVIYHIEAQEDESFIVFEAGIKIGYIYADCEDHGVVWKSSDLISHEFAQKIGDRIERYHC